MSDLISRSELIKELNKYCGNQIYLVSENIREIINNQPTSYDIDKVVEELEQHYDDDSVICGLAYNDAIKKAIEIVKHCGVSDDVCEWKYNDSEYYFESSCDHLHIFMSDGPKENEYDFCPYCGKKIKVVE